MGAGQKPLGLAGKQAVDATDAAEQDVGTGTDPGIAINAEGVGFAPDLYRERGDVAVQSVSPAAQEQDAHREVDELAKRLTEAVANVPRRGPAVAEVLNLKPLDRSPLLNPLGDRRSQLGDLVGVGKSRTSPAKSAASWIIRIIWRVPAGSRRAMLTGPWAEAWGGRSFGVAISSPPGRRHLALRDGHDASRRRAGQGNSGRFWEVDRRPPPSTLQARLSTPEAIRRIDRRFQGPMYLAA